MKGTPGGHLPRNSARLTRPTLSRARLPRVRVLRSKPASLAPNIRLNSRYLTGE
jgi:hypothetical protein